MNGTMRTMAVLAVLLLAMMGLLLVFDVIPREQIQTATIKSLLVLGILTVASLVIGLIMKGGKSD